MSKQLFKVPAARRRRAGPAALAAATLGCGAALAPSNPVPPTQSPATPDSPAASGSSTNITKLEEMTVVGHLDVARNQIVPDLGATTRSTAAVMIRCGRVSSTAVRKGS